MRLFWKSMECPAICFVYSRMILAWNALKLGRSKICRCDCLNQTQLAYQPISLRYTTQIFSSFNGNLHRISDETQFGLTYDPKIYLRQLQVFLIRQKEK